MEPEAEPHGGTIRGVEYFRVGSPECRNPLEARFECDTDQLRAGSPCMRHKSDRLGHGTFQATLFAVAGPGNAMADFALIEPEVSVSFWALLARAALIDASHFAVRGAQTREQMTSFQGSLPIFELLSRILGQCVDADHTQRPAHNLCVDSNIAAWLPQGAQRISPFYTVDMRRLLCADTLVVSDSTLKVGNMSCDDSVVPKRFMALLGNECDWHRL